MKSDETVFSLRLPKRDAERLQREARTRGITISEMARRALAAGLATRTISMLTYGVATPLPGSALHITTEGINVSMTQTAGCFTLTWAAGAERATTGEPDGED